MKYQTRRAISVTAAFYDRLEARAKAEYRSVSGIVEHVLGPILDAADSQALDLHARWLDATERKANAGK
jgi:hypothetical protein